MSKWHICLPATAAAKTASYKVWKMVRGGQARGLTAMRREGGYYSNTDNPIKSCPRQSYWFSCGPTARLGGLILL